MNGFEIYNSKSELVTNDLVFSDKSPIALAVEAERERIIKLLEDNKWRDEVVFDYVIGLIKGENK